MTTDAFSKCHPAVNFLFFLGAIGFGVMIQHPAYLVAGVAAAAVYYLLLKGARGWKLILAMVPLFVFLTAINPLFNIYGATLLFEIFGRPYTVEALLYGGAVAAVFVVMILWFGCYNQVLTSDKFTSLFGNLIPSISLLLVMIFRMVPNLLRKAAQIAGVRKSVGKGGAEAATAREKISDGMTVLDTLTSWALEGGIITGDSMRSRGYGAAKRTSFMIYTMTALDWILLGVMVILGAVVIVFALLGSTAAEYTPELAVAEVSGMPVIGLIAYCLYLLIPTVLHIKEAIQWHISRSKI